MHLQAWDSYYFSPFGVETKLRTYSMVGAGISSSRYSLLFPFFIFKYTLYLCVCVCVGGGGGGGVVVIDFVTNATNPKYLFQKSMFRLNFLLYFEPP